ncbi:AAA family ATPase [Thermaerobacter litoralis]
MQTLAGASLAAPFAKLEASLRARFVERDAEARSFVLALLTGQHIVLVGPPGTAKSAMARAVCQAVEGATYFEWLLGRTTTPEELLGPWDLAALQAGRLERVTSGKLPEAHVGFLDEIFKASTALLNLLLGLMNERRFHNGTRVQPAPLITLVGASNEYPDPEEDTAALWDRFLFRHRVEYLGSDGGFRAMLAQAEPEPEPILTLADVEAARQAVLAVDAGPAVDLLVELRRRLRGEGIVLSDRRWRQSVQVLQASAWLDGRAVVAEADLEALVPVLWDREEQIPTVRKAIMAQAAPLVLEAQDLLDQAQEVVSSFEAADEAGRVAKAVEAGGTLKKILARFERLRAEAAGSGTSGQAARIEALADQVRALHERVMREVLG